MNKDIYKITLNTRDESDEIKPVHFKCTYE